MLTTHRHFCRHIYCAWFYGGGASEGKPDVTELVALVDSRWLRVSGKELSDLCGLRDGSLPPAKLAVVGRVGSCRTKVPRGTTLVVQPGPDKVDDALQGKGSAILQTWHALATALRSPAFPTGDSGVSVLQRVGGKRMLHTFVDHNAVFALNCSAVLIL